MQNRKERYIIKKNKDSDGSDESDQSSNSESDSENEDRMIKENKIKETLYKMYLKGKFNSCL